MSSATMEHRGEVSSSRISQGRLALSLEGGFAEAARLRGNRQIATPPEHLREEIKALLGQARQQCLQAGYDPDDVTLAVYAFTVFLDETILQAPGTAFAHWARQPLQEELFGGAIGGELFFEYLDGALARADSHRTADLLEVFQLCLLLGYRGKFRHAPQGTVATLIQSISHKIRRVRGVAPHLSPLGRPPAGEQVPANRQKDRLLLRLLGVLAVFVLFMLSLFVAFRVNRKGDLNRIQEETTSFVQE